MKAALIIVLTLSATLDYGDISLRVCAYGIDQDGWLSRWWGANPQDGMPYYPIERYAPQPVKTEQGNWGSIKALYR